MFNQFHLIDLNTIPDEEIRQREWSCLLEMLLKHIRVRDIMTYLEQLSGVFSNLLKAQADNYVMSMLKYLIVKADIKDREKFLFWVTENLPPKLEKQAMTLAQQWEKDGYQKGMQQGVQQGMQQGTLAGERAILKRQFIRRFGSLSPRDIEKIENANAETLLIWGERILDAKTMDEIINHYH